MNSLERWRKMRENRSVVPRGPPTEVGLALVKRRQFDGGDYSSRKATIGSTSDAVRAGRYPATSEIAIITTAEVRA